MDTWILHGYLRAGVYGYWILSFLCIREYPRSIPKYPQSIRVYGYFASSADFSKNTSRRHPTGDGIVRGVTLGAGLIGGVCEVIDPVGTVHESCVLGVEDDKRRFL